MTTPNTTEAPARVRKFVERYAEMKSLPWQNVIYAIGNADGVLQELRADDLRVLLAMAAAQVVPGAISDSEGGEL